MRNFFKDRREELGKTQREISVELDMTTSAVSQWENFENCPRLAIAPKLAKAYGVSVERIEQEIVKLSRELAKREAAASAAD